MRAFHNTKARRKFGSLLPADVSPNWGVFERNFNRAFPPAISQPELDFEKEDEDS
jgi:hypothetical protein